MISLVISMITFMGAVVGVLLLVGSAAHYYIYYKSEKGLHREIKSQSKKNLMVLLYGPGVWICVLVERMFWIKLNMKHKNIGATVALVKGIHALCDEDPALVAEVKGCILVASELFVLKAKGCDYVKEDGDNNMCTLFNTLEAPVCNVGNCRLDELAMPTIHELVNSI